MGFDISNLVGKRVEIEYVFAGEKIVANYDPNVITQTRIEEAQKSDDGFITYFCELVRDWDITSAGAEVPIKPDALKAVPMPVIRGLFWHIMRESSSGELGKVSSVNSRRRVPQDRTTKRRSSTATSKSRAGSA